MAERQGALGGVPRHPAITQAIDDQKLRAVAAGPPLEASAQVGLGDRGKRAIAGVRQPDAARDARARGVAPNGPERKAARPLSTRQKMDELSGSRSSDRVPLRGTM